MNNRKFKQILRAFNNYMVFFLMVAFVVSCCMMLFVTVLANTMGLEYAYSAERQQEIEAIRKKYLPKEEDKMEQLRKLHYSATQKAQAASIAIGVAGALIMGTGMSLCMTELGAVLGHLAMIVGILVGIFGMVLVALVYPVYNSVLKKERQRIAPEILRLTEELLK